jgi:hypothetical protein
MMKRRKKRKRMMKRRKRRKRKKRYEQRMEKSEFPRNLKVVSILLWFVYPLCQTFFPSILAQILIIL